MKYEAITIKDIAKALNLSTSTVSRALRDSYEIGEDTKARVKQFAKENNYRPNPVALSLKERKTKSIGVIVSEIANTFFSQVIDGIESVAYDSGYNIIITQSKESFEKEELILQDLISRSVDGLIISLSAETNNYAVLNELLERGMPLVIFDRITNEIDTHKVTIDNFMGAYDATQHLINNGYKSIAIIANNSNLSITKDRLSGYMKALDDNKFTHNKNHIAFCEHGGLEAKEVEEAIDLILKKSKKPDAILALSDKLSTETLRILKKKNIKVPADIALIGFSNSRDTELMNPSLSIIQQPAMEMGKIAASMLLELIDSKKPISKFKSIILSPEVIIRDSSSKK